MTLALRDLGSAPTRDLYQISDKAKIQEATRQTEQNILITNTFLKNVFGENQTFTKYKIELNSANASWNPGSKKLTFGIAPYEGDDGQPAYFTSLGIVAHEIGHAFNGHIRTERLPYQGQSGAIEEASADIFAVMVKRWHFKQISDYELWTIGDKVVKDIEDCTGRVCTIYKQVLRSFIQPGNASETDPQSLQFQKMSIYKDRGGVHINSGILNHAFYRICTETDSTIRTVGKTWFHALAQLQKPYTFENFANTMLDVVQQRPKLKEKYSHIKDIWENVLTTAFSPTVQQKPKSTKKHSPPPNTLNAQRKPIPSRTIVPQESETTLSDMLLKCFSCGV